MTPEEIGLLIDDCTILDTSKESPTYGSYVISREKLIVAIKEAQLAHKSIPDREKELDRVLFFYGERVLGAVPAIVTDIVRQEYIGQIFALFDEEEPCANCDTPLGTSYQKQQIADAVKAERRKVTAVVDDMLDSMGLGEDNFPVSAWQSYQSLKGEK